MLGRRVMSVALANGDIRAPKARQSRAARRASCEVHLAERFRGVVCNSSRVPDEAVLAAQLDQARQLIALCRAVNSDGPTLHTNPILNSQDPRPPTANPARARSHSPSNVNSPAETSHCLPPGSRMFHHGSDSEHRRLWPETRWGWRKP